MSNKQESSRWWFALIIAAVVVPPLIGAEFYLRARCRDHVCLFGSSAIATGHVERESPVDESLVLQAFLASQKVNMLEVERVVTAAERLAVIEAKEELLNPSAKPLAAYLVKNTITIITKEVLEPALYEPVIIYDADDPSCSTDGNVVFYDVDQGFVALCLPMRSSFKDEELGHLYLQAKLEQNQAQGGFAMADEVQH